MQKIAEKKFSDLEPQIVFFKYLQHFLLYLNKIW